MDIKNYIILEKYVDKSILKTEKKIFNYINTLGIETNNIDNNIPKLFIISFDEKISFVEPVFLILLLNFYTKNKELNDKTRMSINISNLKDATQEVIYRFLTHFIDMKYFINIEVAHQEAITKENIVSSFERNRENGLYLEHTCIHQLYPFIKDYSKIEDYRATPIIMTTNASKTEFATGNREDIYNAFLFNIESSFKNIRIRHEKALKDVFQSLGMLENTLELFSSIFFEVLHNIKKHTKDKNDKLANSYINFSTDYNDNFKFLISDDSEKGFLNNYLSVLEQEQENLIETLGV